MKKLLSLLFLFTGIITYAQQKPAIRLNAYTGYVFDDKVDSYYSSTDYYNGTVKGNFQWGVGLEYLIRPVQSIELSYLREDTKAPTTYYDNTAILNPVKDADFDLSINYIFLGTNRYFRPNQKIDPYLGIQLGVGIVNASNTSNGNDNSSTKFAFGIKGGTNIWLNKGIGIKLQAALQSMTQAVGGGVYFGPGYAAPGLASYSSIYQFSLGGGLVLKFGS